MIRLDSRGIKVNQTQNNFTDNIYMVEQKQFHTIKLADSEYKNHYTTC